jgi:flavin-dependent dehydrogenase
MIFDFGIVPRGYGWIFPKSDHLNVGIYTYDARFRLFPAQLRGYIKHKMSRDDVTHVVGHAIAMGAGNDHHQSRRLFLVGDAGGFCEPVLGEGIFYAIRSGQMAAASIIEEQKHGRRADHSFRTLSRYLRSDLRTASNVARRFYRNLAIGYLVLTSPIVRYALMKGASLGVPLGHIPSTWLSFPFRRPFEKILL